MQRVRRLRIGADRLAGERHREDAGRRRQGAGERRRAARRRGLERERDGECEPGDDAAGREPGVGRDGRQPDEVQRRRGAPGRPGDDPDGEQQRDDRAQARLAGEQDEQRDRHRDARGGGPVGIELARDRPGEEHRERRRERGAGRLGRGVVVVREAQREDAGQDAEEREDDEPVGGQRGIEQADGRRESSPRGARAGHGASLRRPTAAVGAGLLGSCWASTTTKPRKRASGVRAARGRRPRQVGLMLRLVVFVPATAPSLGMAAMTASVLRVLVLRMSMA